MSPSTNRKAKAAIYRKAARRIAEGEHRFSCIAIDSIKHGGDGWDKDYSSEAKRFQAAFAPPDWDVLIAAHAESAGGDSWRILALCFMAAMVEAGDA